MCLIKYFWQKKPTKILHYQNTDMKRMMITILSILLILYATLCLVMYFKQEWFIFLPDKLPQEFEFSYPNANEVFLPIENNQHIHGLYFSDVEQPKGVILYFHGNAGALDKWGIVAEDFLPHSYDVFIVDYRTYGKSEGSLSEEHLFNDAQLAYDYLSKKFEPKNIVIYGRSIGTGIATHLASKNNCKTLILETPYYNLYDIVKNHFRLIPKKNLLRYNFRNDIHLKNVNSPVYIFHGTADRVVPFNSGVKLKPFINPEHFVIIPNANHHNIGQYPIYHQTLNNIL